MKYQKPFVIMENQGTPGQLGPCEEVTHPKATAAETRARTVHSHVTSQEVALEG